MFLSVHNLNSQFFIELNSIKKFQLEKTHDDKIIPIEHKGNIIHSTIIIFQNGNFFFIFLKYHRNI